MSPEFLAQLQERKAEIQCRWLQLVTAGEQTLSIGVSEHLRTLIADAFSRVIAVGQSQELRRQMPIRDSLTPVRRIPCGQNPYRRLYLLGEQAMTEQVVLGQWHRVPVVRTTADFVQLIDAVRTTAAAEGSRGCGVCTQRGRAPDCDFTE